MRYAIVASGGKQYLAREGQSLEVDRLGKSAGQGVEFSDVLLAADGQQVLVGTPSVSGARVTGTVQGEIRGEKIIVFRYQPKKRRRRKLGHRQTYTRVMIEKIEAPGLGRSTVAAEARPAAKPTPPKKAAKPKAATAPRPAKPAAAKPAPRKPAARPASKKKS
jgi:large subunit ribosomal protein L21